MPEPKTTTAADLRAQARLIRETARTRMQQIEADAEAEAETLERAAAVLDGLKSGLPREADSVTNETMTASGIVSEPRKRRPGVKATPKGTVGRAVTILGITIRELAKRLGEEYESVRTWKARGRLPADVEKKILDMVDEHQRAHSRSKKTAE